MAEFMPEDIRVLIERLETKKGEAYRAQKRAKDAERERLAAIEALRQERADELRAACRRIGAWIERFNETAGPAIWQLLGERSALVIFSAKFFRGEPTPPGDVVGSAQLRIGGPEVGATDRLVYEESQKGQIVARHPLLGVTMLWMRAHPDFVAQCDAQLAGPDAWKHVRQRLQQMDGRLAAV